MTGALLQNSTINCSTLQCSTMGSKCRSPLLEVFGHQQTVVGRLGSRPELSGIDTFFTMQRLSKRFKLTQEAWKRHKARQNERAKNRRHDLQPSCPSWLCSQCGCKKDWQQISHVCKDGTCTCIECRNNKSKAALAKVRAELTCTFSLFSICTPRTACHHCFVRMQGAVSAHPKRAVEGHLIASRPQVSCRSAQDFMRIQRESSCRHSPGVVRAHQSTALHRLGVT